MKYCAIPAVLGTSTIAQAAEIQREYRSARYLGMGDTGISLSEGHDALFYNPAGIADVKGIVNEIVLASPQVEVSANAKSLYTSISTHAPASNIIRQIEGEPQHIAVQNFTGLVFRRAAIGVYERGQADVFLGTDPAKGMLVANGDVLARAGINTAFGRSFMNDQLLLGINLKFAQKNEGTIALDALTAEEQLKGLTPSSALSRYVQRGNGAGGDVGMIWKFADTSRTRFGLVARNVGDMNYPWAIPSGSKGPSSDKQTIDVGASIAPSTKKSSAAMAIDYRDVLNANGDSPYKRIHMGARLSFQGILGFVAGLNQGYPTYGAFVNFKIVRAEAGYYSEELGKNPGDIRSRRLYARLAVGWSQ